VVGDSKLSNSSNTGTKKKKKPASSGSAYDSEGGGKKEKRRIGKRTIPVWELKSRGGQKGARIHPGSSPEGTREREVSVEKSYNPEASNRGGGVGKDLPKFQGKPKRLWGEGKTVQESG